MNIVIKINDHNKETGFIGNKCGVDCYVKLIR